MSDIQGLSIKLDLDHLLIKPLLQKEILLMQRYVLLVVFSALFLAACGEQEASAPALSGVPALDAASSIISDEVPVPIEGFKLIALDVEGMHCTTNCAPKAHQALASVEGVDSVQVSVTNQAAWVSVPQDSELTAEQLAQEINDNTGFTASPQAG